MSYLSGLENRLTIPDLFHPVTVGIPGDGITITLEGNGISWATHKIVWSQWDRLVAWVEWRRREIEQQSVPNQIDTVP
ncbi:MAG: hypothetical protein Q7O66_15130 [Dehalococcoidia bacterium]|nr:hypothetical protein [Dehalococcoidia bacterium]